MRVIFSSILVRCIFSFYLILDDPTLLLTSAVNTQSSTTKHICNLVLLVTRGLPIWIIRVLRSARLMTVGRFVRMSVVFIVRISIGVRWMGSVTILLGVHG
jgi:hypothetical protein